VGHWSWVDWFSWAKVGVGGIRLEDKSGSLFGHASLGGHLVKAVTELLLLSFGEDVGSQQ
jgi:hypothetical protein